MFMASLLQRKKKFKKLVKTNNLNAKKAISEKLLSWQTNNPDDFWKLVKKLRESKKSNENPISISQWEEYFKVLHRVNQAALAPDHEDKNIETNFRLKLNSTNICQIMDAPFSLLEIKDGIKKLKNKKACGPDSISNEMIKTGQNVLLKSIKTLFNSIIDEEIFPSEWSSGYLVPLFKSGDKTDPSNYRGISITSCLGKLFSSLLNNRLLKLMKDYVM